jgi:putative component of membrane protein insertase Oxa1/YidC/SpoIIIJ protein YidD
VLRLLRCHPFVSGGFDPAIKHGAASHPVNGK